MVKNKKINKKILFSFVGIFLIFFSLSSYAYYTNIGKWLDEQNNAYLGGEGQQRLGEDFIKGGCDIDANGINDTMLDTITGLCWDKNLNIGTGTIRYATTSSYSEPTWNETIKAYDYPAGRTINDYPAFKLCEELTTGGHTDWRMPEIGEFFTLFDEIGGNGAVCTTLQTFGFINCQDRYWSANQQGASSYGIYIYLYRSFSSYSLKANTNYIACVRNNN